MRLPRILGRHVALLLTAAALALPGLPAEASPAEGFTQPYFGSGRTPAGCIWDRNPANPDNHCYHMLTGLNALDSPQVDVTVLVPVSPTAERDLRLMQQSVQMWAGGIHYLSDQMNLPWLRDGVKFNITAEAVPVDDAGNPTDPINLVDPEIVVIATNPVGGLGIGIDPSNFASQVGITDGQGVPCTEVPDAFSMKAWQARPGFQQHGNEPGGIYVQDCGGVGGNVCFSVNGAVDPVPGASDFFPIFDLVSHETGHCLTLGHVGDGADGPWGPTPTNDIMAYSTDPPGIAKCVSTLDVASFALRMSRYLDVNGDGKVDNADVLSPNRGSYQTQNPADHFYASASGAPGDCPQPNYSPVPGSGTLIDPVDWTPAPVKTTKPRLGASTVAIRKGRLKVVGSAGWVSTTPAPTATSGSVTDPALDSTTPVTDITNWKVTVSDTAVDAEMKVTQLWAPEIGSAATAYSILIDGRRLDSFVPNGSTDGKPVVMDNGTGYYLPPGTATWDAATNTVKFHVLREYLDDNNIQAPYAITGVTGVHERANDWVTDDDHAPDKGGLDLTGPAMKRVTQDKPVATSVTTKTVNVGGGTFSTAAWDLLLTSNPAGDDARFPLPITEQSTVQATLSWNDPNSSFAFHVNNGSQQRVISSTATSITVEVPWARRDMIAVVSPSILMGVPEVAYTIKATITTVIADRDHDSVPDVADVCADKPGPRASGGCPDTDRDGVLDKNDLCIQRPGIGYDGCPTTGGEQIRVYVDGVRKAVLAIMTRHGSYDFALTTRVRGTRHKVRIVWISAGKVISTTTRQLR